MFQAIRAQITPDMVAGRRAVMRFAEAIGSMQCGVGREGCIRRAKV